MSNLEYIEVPIETSPDELAADAFDFIQARIPGWVPNDGNLETIVTEALSFMTAESRDVASAVPTDIFRYFGKIVNILPQDESFATGVISITVVDTAGYTIPAGTQVGIQTTGNEVLPFEIVSDVVIPTGSSTATGITIQAMEAGTDSSGLADTLTVVLLDTLAYVSSLDLTTGTSGGEDAETTDEYINRLSARLSLMTQHPILANDFAVFAQDIDGVARATALDGYNPDHNLLTVNQSSLETDTTGWIADTNCTIARSTAQAADGIASLSLTSAAGGDMYANTNPVTTYGVQPLQQITAIAYFRTQTSARSCRLELLWYDAGSSFISASNGGSVTDSTSAWTQAFVTALAPVTAAFVRIRVRVISTGAASEVHYVDKIALKHAPSLNWNIGGTGEFNQERYVTIVAVDDVGQPVSGAIKLAIDNYLEAKREVNFIVEEIDATYTTIDVQFTGTAMPGFVASAVKAACEAAIASYLSPANWGLPDVANQSDIASITPLWRNTSVIRLYELATIINNVSGFDYIVPGTLQIRIAGGSFATADITMGGPAPLPQPGTITGTIT